MVQKKIQTTLKFQKLLILIRKPFFILDFNNIIIRLIKHIDVMTHHSHQYLDMIQLQKQ